MTVSERFSKTAVNKKEGLFWNVSENFAQSYYSCVIFGGTATARNKLTYF